MKVRLRPGVAGASSGPRSATATRLRRGGVALCMALPVAGLATGAAAPLAGAAGSTHRHDAATSGKVLYLGAIPDQNQNELQKIYGTLSSYLTQKLGVKVVYRPVTDYTAAVSQFRTGNLDLVWFGGLTGVQAYMQTPGSEYLVQRNIDGSFHSYFIVNSSTGIHHVQHYSGLKALKGVRFTFGSNSSTSGYLMPAFWLLKAGVDPRSDFSGQPGFSGSHDKTIDLVQSGTYQAGAVNEQVWDSRVASHTVNLKKVHVIWKTPSFHDYNWMLSGQAVKEFGKGFAWKLKRTFLDISPKTAAGRKILGLFGCKKFVPTKKANYNRVKAVGKQLGLISS